MLTYYDINKLSLYTDERISMNKNKTILNFVDETWGAPRWHALFEVWFTS